MASFVAFDEAQAKLGELIDRAERGEEIVIQRNGQDSAKLVSIPAAMETRAGKRIFGQNFLGATIVDPNWDAPMSEEELKEWGY